MSTNLSINSDRLWQTLMASADTGCTPAGGIRRLTLGDEDKVMRDLFASWVRAEGYGLKIDRLGSMFVRREGTDANAAPVLIGSHLDT